MHEPRGNAFVYCLQPEVACPPPAGSATSRYIVCLFSTNKVPAGLRYSSGGSVQICSWRRSLPEAASWPVTLVCASVNAVAYQRCLPMRLSSASRTQFAAISLRLCQRELMSRRLRAGEFNVNDHEANVIPLRCIDEQKFRSRTKRC
jgi:hypothetical protein